MDPISQAALGAVVGQAAGHRQLGYRAAVAGAFAGALPDVDVVFSVGGDAFDQLVLHRGITHSLFFAPVAGPTLGTVGWYLAGRSSLGRWMLVMTLALWSHPLLDWLTSYGTQLLRPFSDARFAVDAMPIIDPLYTGLLLLGLLIAWRQPRRAVTVATVTLVVSSAYLGYGWQQNVAAQREASRQLVALGIDGARVSAFPTLLQVYYRRVVARTADEDRVGFLSTWQPCTIDWQVRPRMRRDDPLIQSFLQTREGHIFDWFSMGWGRYRIDSPTGRLIATDLRYGFDADPDRSIFSASVAIDDVGRLTGPAVAGQYGAADADAGLLGSLLQRTFGADCQQPVAVAGRRGAGARHLVRGPSAATPRSREFP